MEEDNFNATDRLHTINFSESRKNRPMNLEEIYLKIGSKAGLGWFNLIATIVISQSFASAEMLLYALPYLEQFPVYICYPPGTNPSLTKYVCDRSEFCNGQNVNHFIYWDHYSSLHNWVE